MKAVVKYGNKDGMVELRDMPEPKVGPGEVLLEVKAAGVCGSDIEFYRHSMTYSIAVPVIQGHEFCGVVAEVGPEVKNFKVGDRVVSETAAYICGQCRYCLAGEYNVCPQRKGFGYGVNGAFTRWVRVPVRCLHRIPDGVPFDHAALTEPLCVAYNALVVKSRIPLGETVAIVGPGPIGLFCLQVAKASGAGKTVVVGTKMDGKRFEIARKLGADATVNADASDPVAEVNRLTDGVGAAVVVDAAGTSIALKTSLDIVRRNGQITKLGWGPEPLGFSLDPLISKAVTLQGSFSHTWRTWEMCLELIRTKQIDMESMITHRFTIEDWKTAFHLMEEKETLKALLRPV
jgi:alcohol dehydrogenase/L-iditol 2-dehydrogenase